MSDTSPDRARSLECAARQKKTVYLCGGINGLSDADCRDWREFAKAHLQTGILDPMRRDYRGVEDQHWDDIVRGDLEDIDASDVVLVNATRPSWGTAMEVFYAHSKDKMVVAWVGHDGVSRGVSPWLRYHSDAILLSLEDAIEAINAHAAL